MSEKGTASHVEVCRSIDAPQATPANNEPSTMISTPQDTPQDYRISWKTILPLLSLLLAFGAFSAQLVTPSTIAHQVEAVGGSRQSSWIANSANVVSFATTAICGSIGDHWSKKHLILLGLAIGFTGCMTASRANKIGEIIAGQGLVGLSSALLVVVQPAGMEILPNRKRPIATVGFLVFLVLASIGCTLSTGYCIKYNVTGAGWRWVYYVPAILDFCAFVSVAITYFPPPPRIARGKKTTEILKDFDFLGMLLLMTGAIFLLIGFSWGGSAYPWASARVVSFICIGIVFCACFAVWDWRGTIMGLLPHALFSEGRNLPLLMAISFTNGIVMYGGAAYLPQMITAIFTNDPVYQTLPLVLSSVTEALGGVISAFYLLKWKRYRAAFLVAGLWLGAWLGAAAAITPDKRWLSYVAPIIATGVAITNMIRTFGGTIGVAIFSSVLSNEEKKQISALFYPAAIQAGLSASTSQKLLTGLAYSTPDQLLLEKIPGVTKQAILILRPLYKLALAQSYRYVWLSVMPFALLGAFMALFLQPIEKYMTNHVESKLEPEAKISD
ncbi:fungal trichothecene efflux pump-domain-containing protein [Aspergillus insuetus]